MRGLMTPRIGVSLAAVLLAVSGGAAVAQPSTDQIIAGLKGPISGASRGIKPAAPSQAAAPAQAYRPQAVATQTQVVHRPAAPVAARPMTPPPAVSGPSVNLTVNFPSGSSELTPGARASLDALGRALASNDLANYRFRIEGHTDSVGSREENLILSQRRAEAVVVYLTGQYRIDAARLEPVGVGQERPAVETAPQTPSAQNRRVQVINLGGA